MNEQHLSKAPTLQQVLIVHAETFRRRTGMSHEQWAERLDHWYCALVAPDHRALPAPDLGKVDKADDYRKLLRAWDQTVRRYVDGSLKFPLELMEAWISALDEPWRGECNREVAHRRGLVGAQRHEPSPAGDHRAWGEALQHWGALTQRMGEVLKDGSINGDDLPHLPDLLQHIDAMEADLASLKHQARRAMSEEEGATDIRSVK